MHIPDNYLSPSTCAMMFGAMIPVWAVSIKKVKEEVPKERLPLMGVGAAFSFLIMMFNVPLPGGTTGHAVGGTLLGILLGPWAANISISAALFVQALLFGDGGILTFGANSFNMAFVMPFLGYFFYSLIKEKFQSSRGEITGIIVGSYLGINFAALSVAIEFGIQPMMYRDASGNPLYAPYPLSVSLPAMTIPHLAVIGVVETIFTLAIFTFIKKVSPGTIYKGSRQRFKVIYGLIIALILLSPFGLLAHGTAWGEWNPNQIKQETASSSSSGFIPKGIKNGFDIDSLFQGYSIKGMPEYTGYILSAIIAVAIFVIIFKLAANLKKTK